MIRLFAPMVLLSGLVVASEPVWSSAEFTPGPNSVGVRQLEAEQSGLELRMTLWYPALSNAGAPRVRIADYVELANGGGRNRDDIGKLLATSLSRQPLDAALRLSTAEMPMYAVRNAEPKAGVRYPLVLWGARRDTPLGQSVLSEYLASHGYVVAFANPIGVDLPPPFETTEAGRKAAILDGHVAHLRAALNWLGGQSWIDASRVAVVGWSYAGSRLSVWRWRSPSE